MIFEKSNWTKTDFFLEKTDSLILPLKPYHSGILHLVWFLTDRLIFFWQVRFQKRSGKFFLWSVIL